MINQIPGIASHTQTDYEIANVFLKCGFGGVCPQQSQSFAFDKSFTDPWWVAGRIMRILKCLSRFQV